MMESTIIPSLLCMHVWERISMPPRKLQEQFEKSAENGVQIDLEMCLEMRIELYAQNGSKGVFPGRALIRLPLS
jgi:hypothetical protein